MSDNDSKNLIHNWPLIDVSLTDECGQPKTWRFTNVDKALVDVDLPNQLHKDIWNRAIDAAIRLVNLGQEQDIRKLKV